MKLICIICAFMLCSCVFNSGSNVKESMPGATVVVIANGLVCDFCGRTIEKTLKKQPEIARTDIDLSSKKITLTMNPGMNISDDELVDLIQDAGFGVERVVREG
jgi:copper chaperone CopZ